MTVHDYPAAPIGHLGRVAKEAIYRYRAQHNEHELLAALALISYHDVATVLEIGTADCGSAWAWAQLPYVRTVITVDVQPPAGPFPYVTDPGTQVIRVTGNSADPDTRSGVMIHLQKRQVDLLVIDGDHTGEMPKSDYMLYHGLVRPGGLILIHDTQGYPGRDDFTTPALWADLIKAYDHVELVARKGGPGGTGILWT